MSATFDPEELRTYRKQVESEQAQFSKNDIQGEPCSDAGQDELAQFFENARQGEQAGQGKGAGGQDDRSTVAQLEQAIKFIDIKKALAAPPEPRLFIVSGYVAAGIIGAFSGEGGIGKSYLAEIMAVAVACGKDIPPFEIETPGPVLFVSVEDDEIDLRGRLYWIAHEYDLTPAERAILAGNLYIASARGILGPLMGYDGVSFNPGPTVATQWLRKMIDKHNPVLVILDTKSRLFGLDENSNDHAAQWVSNLESLLVGRPHCSIMVIAHIGKKSGDQAEDQYSSRGASAFVDNSRAVLMLTKASDKDMKMLGAKSGQVYKMTHGKSSYSAQRVPVYFIKNPVGVPRILDAADIRNESLSRALDELVDWLLTEHSDGLNKKMLLRADKTPCKAIRAEIIEDTGIRVKDWGAVVQLGIESGRLIEEDDMTSSAPRKPVMVRARVAMQEESAPEPEQQTIFTMNKAL